MSADHSKGTFNSLSSAEIQQESLQLLDWRAVCAQVACFAATPMAADQILQTGLPMGASQVMPVSLSIQAVALLLASVTSQADVLLALMWWSKKWEKTVCSGGL